MNTKVDGKKTTNERSAIEDRRKERASPVALIYYLKEEEEKKKHLQRRPGDEKKQGRDKEPAGGSGSALFYNYKRFVAVVNAYTQSNTTLLHYGNY